MEFICDTHAFPDDEDVGHSDCDAGADFDPNLTHLIIDGENFRQTWDGLNDCRESLEQITIAHYEQNDEYCLEDILQSLDTMHSLEQLKFDSLQFVFHQHDNSNNEMFVTMPYIYLQDVSESFIAEHSDFCYFDPFSVLLITRCPLPGLHKFCCPPETLILEDISRGVDLLAATTAWEGEIFWLDRCHSFSDAFLKVLGRRCSLLYPCNEMRRLLLYRLPSFSLSLLKKMIK
jgi:hypothetical protein